MNKEKKEKETYSITPEKVAEEIMECPHEALGNQVVLMLFDPDKKTKSGIILPDTGEPSNRKVPMGFIVSKGDEITNVKEGDLVKFAGTYQEDYTNGKTYLIMYKINLLTKIKLEKVTSWV